jgi:hypothetical protein
MSARDEYLAAQSAGVAAFAAGEPVSANPYAPSQPLRWGQTASPRQQALAAMWLAGWRRDRTPVGPLPDEEDDNA